MVITFVSCEIPAPDADDYKRDALGRMVLRSDWTPRRPGPFWPILAVRKSAKSAPEILPPEEAASLVASGDARVEDPSALRDAVMEFASAARLTPTERRRYLAVAGAESKRRKAEAHRRIAERMGLVAGDDVDPRVVPVLLTTEEVADLLRMSADSVRRADGQSLPKSIRVGGRRLFKSEAILAMIGAAA